MGRIRLWVAGFALLAVGVLGGGLGVLRERAGEPAPGEQVLAPVLRAAPSASATDAPDLRGDVASPGAPTPTHARAVSRGESVGQTVLVVRLKGAPEAPVRIQALRLGEAAWTRCTGQQDGVLASAETVGSRPVELPVAAGTGFALLVSAVGDVVARVVRSDLQLPPGRRSELELDFPAPSWFHGLVVAQGSGRPISGAGIQALGKLAGCLKATSAPDGTFKVPLGDYEDMRVHSPGHAAIDFVLDTEHTDPYRPRRLELPSSGSLAIRVRRSDRSPAGGLEVRVSANASVLDGVWRTSATTSEDGTCEVADVPNAAALRVDLYRDGRVLFKGPYVTDLRPDELRRIEIEIPAAARVEGRLVDQRGTPLADVRLAISPGHHGRGQPWDSAQLIAQETISAADGSFAFTEVPSGKWKIGPLDPAGDAAEYAQPVDIPAGADEVHVTIVAYMGLSITGRILHADGRPAEGIYVSADTEFSTRSDAEGRFTLDSAWDEEFEVHSLPPSTPVRVRPGAAPLTLRLLPAGTLRGVIVAAESARPVSGQIRVRSLTSGSSRDASAIAEQKFEVEGLPPDRYEITAWTADGAIGSIRDVKVDAGDVLEGLRIEVEPGSTITFDAAETFALMDVLDLGGQSVCSFFSVVPGETFSCVVQPGAWTVRQRREGRVADEVKLTLRRGERRSVTPGRP